MKKGVLLSLFVLTSVLPSVHAEGRFSGYMFGDYYYVASHDVTQWKNQNGFQFRRIYLTYDNAISERWATRFRLEATQGDWTGASAKMTPTIKDAYLKYTHGLHAGSFGISPTPTWNKIEKFWGYRAVEKTPLDLQGWGSSRDTGVALSGSFDQDQKYGYHIMYGNSESNSHEDNKNGGAYLALQAKPLKGLFVEMYGDYHNNDNDCASGAAPATNVGACAQKSSKATGQLFIGYKGGWGRAGFQYAHQHEGLGDAGGSGPTAGAQTVLGRHMNLFSVFLVGQIRDDLHAFARYDYIDYPHAASPAYWGNAVAQARSHLMIFGVDKAYVDGSVHLLPNVEVMAFGKSTAAEGAGSRVTGAGQAGRSIIIPRLTVFWKFK